MQYIYVLGPKEQWGIQLLAENKKAETGTPFLSLLANQNNVEKRDITPTPYQQDQHNTYSQYSCESSRASSPSVALSVSL